MKVYKLTLEGLGSYIADTIGLIADEVELGEVGDKYTVEILEMAEDEFNALPEFDGF